MPDVASRVFLKCIPKRPRRLCIDLCMFLYLFNAQYQPHATWYISRFDAVTRTFGCKKDNEKKRWSHFIDFIIFVFSLLPLAAKDDLLGYYLALRLISVGVVILLRSDIKKDFLRINQVIPGLLEGRQGGFAAPLGALLFFQEVLFYLIAFERPPSRGWKHDYIIYNERSWTMMNKENQNYL